MNIMKNQRYTSTEDSIQRALFSLLRFKKYDSISIKELCYEAGINRSSFYTHYQDINDLMIQTEQRLSKSIQELFKLETEWNEKTFIELFAFLKKNKDFYKAYLETNEQTFMEKNDFIKYQNLVLKSSKLNFPQNEIGYHMAFFAGGLKAISKYWLKSNCKESPEMMAEIIKSEYLVNFKYFSNKQD